MLRALLLSVRRVVGNAMSKKLVWQGRKDDSLFWTPILELGRANELPQLFQKVALLEDHRIIVIVTALIVENRLDRLLEAFLPRYQSLLDTKEFTFSMKLKLLTALRFVPPLIVSSGDNIRSIRNEFAHNLDIATLEEVKKKYTDRMKVLRAEAYRGNESPFPADATLLQAFRSLSFFCIAGFDAYRDNLQPSDGRSSSPASWI